MTRAEPRAQSPVGGEPVEAPARARARLAGLAGLAVLAGLAYRALFARASDPPFAMLPGAERHAPAEPGDFSPVIVFALVAWLLWRRRAALRASLARAGGWLPAAALLAAASALHLWSHHTGASDLLLPSLSLLLLGAGALLGGAAALRALWLPAVVLLFAFPAPAVLVNQLMYPLQLATAQLAAALHALIGATPVVSGDMLWLGGRPFEVIESCSGIASIAALTLAAVVYVELSWRDPLQALVVVAAAPPVAFAVNGLRVLALVADPSFDPEADHSLQGLVTILIGVFLLTCVDRLLARLRRAPAPPAAPPTPRVAAPASAARWLALAALLAALVVVPHAVPRWQPEPTGAPPLARSVPASVGPWRGTPDRVDARYLGRVGFSDATAWRYERPGIEPIQLLVAVDERRDRRVSGLSPKTRLPSFGWHVEEQRALRAGPGDWRQRALQLRSPDRRQLVHYGRAGVAPLAVEVLRALLALDQSFLRRPEPARIARLGTPVAETPKGLAAAEARLERFAQELAQTPLAARLR